MFFIFRCIVTVELKLALVLGCYNSARGLAKSWFHHWINRLWCILIHLLGFIFYGLSEQINMIFALDWKFESLN